MYEEFLSKVSILGKCYLVSESEETLVTAEGFVWFKTAIMFLKYICIVMCFK